MNTGNQTQETELHRLTREEAAAMNAAGDESPTPDVPQKSEPATEAPNNTPKVIEEEDGEMARWTSDAPIVASNVSQTTPAGRALVTRALATADLKTRSAVGQVLRVKAYVAHKAEVMDKLTGELHVRTRCVLLLEDGRTWSTMSKGCIRTIHYISHVTEAKEWNPPILLEVREFPLEGGKSYCDLREVMPESEEPMPTQPEQGKKKK